MKRPYLILIILIALLSLSACSIGGAKLGEIVGMEDESFKFLYSFERSLEINILSPTKASEFALSLREVRLGKVTDIGMEDMIDQDFIYLLSYGDKVFYLLNNEIILDRDGDFKSLQRYPVKGEKQYRELLNQIKDLF